MKPLGAKIIERPAAPLLSIETLRRHCEVVAIETDSDGVETHPDDELLLAFLDAAVDHAEQFTGRSIMLRTYELALDDFPRPRRWGCHPRDVDHGIEVPFPPLIDVVSFTYADGSDGEMEQGVDYLVDSYGDVARLRPLLAWPAVTTTTPNRVLCRYRAGYMSEVDPDSGAEPLPGGIKAAILLMVNHLYENRSASSEKAMTELPLGVESLLRQWRVRTGMA